MNKKTQLIIAGVLVAMLLLLTACNQEKLLQTSHQQPSVQPQVNQQVQQQLPSSSIQIPSQEETDGINQAIAELEETDTQ